MSPVLWVELLGAAAFITGGIARAIWTRAGLIEALIDTAIGLGAVLLAVSELVRGPALALLQPLAGQHWSSVWLRCSPVRSVTGSAPRSSWAACCRSSGPTCQCGS